MHGVVVTDPKKQGTLKRGLASKLLFLSCSSVEKIDDLEARLGKIDLNCRVF